LRLKVTKKTENRVRKIENQADFNRFRRPVTPSPTLPEDIETHRRTTAPDVAPQPWQHHRKNCPRSGTGSSAELEPKEEFSTAVGGRTTSASAQKTKLDGFFNFRPAATPSPTYLQLARDGREPSLRSNSTNSVFNRKVHPNVSIVSPPHLLRKNYPNQDTSSNPSPLAIQIDA